MPVHGRVLHRDEEADGGVSAAGSERSCQRHVVMQTVPADLPGRRSVRDGPGLLPPALPVHVPGPQVFIQVLQLARNPQEAGDGWRAENVQVRRPRGLRLPKNAEQPAASLLPQAQKESRQG